MTRLPLVGEAYLLASNKKLREEHSERLDKLADEAFRHKLAVQAVKVTDPLSEMNPLYALGRLKDLLGPNWPTYESYAIVTYGAILFWITMYCRLNKLFVDSDFTTVELDENLASLLNDKNRIGEVITPQDYILEMVPLHTSFFPIDPGEERLMNLRLVTSYLIIANLRLHDEPELRYRLGEPR